MRANQKRSTTQARKLRKTLTRAETLLWKNLRKKQILDLHFRRQVPIGPYIADFACHAVKLVVEVDGDSHAKADEIRRDESRTAYLENEGWTVIRFWNVDIYENLEGVLEAIGTTARDLQLASEQRSAND